MTIRMLRVSAVLLGLAAVAAAQNTSVVSLSPDGVAQPATFYGGSPDLRWIPFRSEAYALVPGLAGGGFAYQTYLADTSSGVVLPVSVSTHGVWGNGDSGSSAVSDDGSLCAFGSYASNLVAADSNGTIDIFVGVPGVGTLERVNLGPGGLEANDWSSEPAISSDGRFVAFTSMASNLVAGDTNAERDVFVRDRLSGVTERVSVSSLGLEGDEESSQPSISGDGRWVTFSSDATNLVPGDTNAERDAFLHDRQTGTTVRVSVSSAGVQGNGETFYPILSRDGSALVFQSGSSNLVAGDLNFRRDVFRHVLASGTTTRVSLSDGGAEANHHCELPWVSGNGRFVSFRSSSTNLVAGDTNQNRDNFVRDTLTDSTTRVSVGPGGVQSGEDSEVAVVSTDGLRAAFSSQDTGLVPAIPLGQPQAFPPRVLYLFDTAAPPADVYCTAKVNSAGCTPTISFSGTPGYDGADDWHVLATDVINNQFGILIWSTGFASTPFGGGTLCLASPVNRTGGQFSAGSASGNDCTGSYDFHVSFAFLLGNLIPSGETLFTQYWSRDPAFPPPGNIGLSAGLWFFVLP